MFQNAPSGITGDQPGLVSAAAWLAELMTGTLATFIAILAVASLGFAMLLGRLPARHGMRIVMGCFILFGAPYLAAALSSVTVGGQHSNPSFSTHPAQRETHLPRPEMSQPNPFEQPGYPIPMN